MFLPLSTTKPFAGSLPYVRRHLTTSKKPQVATCPAHLVLSHDKPGWTTKLGWVGSCWDLGLDLQILVLAEQSEEDSQRFDRS